MYEVDHQDKVVELQDIPQSSVGAPIPIVLAGEHDVLVSYYLQNTPSDWDGTSVRVADANTEGEPVATVKFINTYAHMFGAPNDEAFSGHPLSDRGLEPYTAFKIENSSWIRKLEKMNAVHHSHDLDFFMQNKQHFIFAFHDSTFECVANDMQISIAYGSVSSMVPRMLEQLR